MSRIYPYTTTETDYLSSKDAKLARFIRSIGHIERETDNDLFSSIVHQIIAQQISNKAQQAVFNRVCNALEKVTVQSVISTDEEAFRKMGLSRMKARYIRGAAKMAVTGEIDLEAIEKMTDNDAVNALKTIKGCGEWTAQMVLLFGLLRKNVLSKKDAGIRRGVKIVYEVESDDKVDKVLEDIAIRLSPYCSVASLYLWQAAGGQ